jgi:hypothetical protein
MLSYRRDAESDGPVTPPPLEPVHVDAVRVTYDSQAVQAEPPEEPTPIPVSTSDPEPIPEPLPSPVSEPPKAELKEIAVQTDKWVSTPPASPVHLSRTLITRSVQDCWHGSSSVPVYRASLSWSCDDEYTFSLSSPIPFRCHFWCQRLHCHNNPCPPFVDPR